MINFYLVVITIRFTKIESLGEYSGGRGASAGNFHASQFASPAKVQIFLSRGKLPLLLHL